MSEPTDRPPKTSTSLRFALLLTAASGFLDAYTYISRGGVFANAQTGNVILLGVDLSEQRWHSALAHLWPILAFIVGVAIANWLKSERAHDRIDHPIRWAMLGQVIVLAAVGFVPSHVPNAVVTIPIAFVAAIQIGLFRTGGDLAFIAIATTGNLMRFTESGYAVFVEKKRESRRANGYLRGDHHGLRGRRSDRSSRDGAARRHRRMDTGRAARSDTGIVLCGRPAGPLSADLSCRREIWTRSATARISYELRREFK